MSNVLTWIKSHLAIVIMCAVSIIVLPVVLYFSSVMNAKIAKEIEQRVSKQSNDMTRVSNVSISITPLTPEDTSVSLKRTINPKILEDFRTAREKIKSDAERLEQLAIDINRSSKEGQLVPGLLPKPDRSVAQELPYRIHEAYIAAHDELVSDLNASLPQPPDLVQEQLTEFRDNYLRSQFNVPTVASLSPTEYAKLKEAMTSRRLAIYSQIAREYSVYADRSVFALQDWNRPQAPDSLRWYEWQHTYWVDRDIVEAIRKANTVDGEPTTIVGPETSVVKRIRGIMVAPIFPSNVTEQSLIKPASGEMGNEQNLVPFREGGGPVQEMPPIGMEGGMGEGGPPRNVAPGSITKFNPEGTVMERGGPSGSSTATAAPVDAAAVADANQQFPDDFSKSISGRTEHNGLYDMRKVTLDLVVDSSRLDKLFEAIASTNFMTVTGVRVLPLDLDAELAAGFLYGPDPVVNVQIDLETLWLRDWTVSLMPDAVKKFLNVPTEEPKG